MSTLSPPTSPFQRIADALAAEPGRWLSVQVLAKEGQCASPLAIRCAERLVREGQVRERIDSSGRVWWRWVCP